MKSKNTQVAFQLSKRGMLRTAVASAVLSSALSLFSTQVMAQASSGSIYGRAAAGSTVTIKNVDTGATRQVSVGNSGQFQLSEVLPGNYDVSVATNGKVTSSKLVDVTAGSGSAVTFDSVGATKLETVTVRGRTKKIDTSTAQVSTSYSARQLLELPVAKDAVSVALLAPGTTKGDAAYGNLAAFGGASVAENSYYVNGFNVTNLFQNLAFADIPFYAIADEQVFTGGYGPEFGLSTGGVVNITTKKGGNNWTAGGAVTWNPSALRSNSPSTRTVQTKEPFRYYGDDTSDLQQVDLYFSGPIIKDTLFIYGIGEFSKIKDTRAPNTYDGGNSVTFNQRNPFGLANVLWNINDSNTFEATYISNTKNFQDDQFGTTPNGDGFAVRDEDSYLGKEKSKSGGNIYFGKYTSYLTDDLTLSLLYGRLENSKSSYQVLPDGTRVSYDGQVGNFNQPGCPLVTQTGVFAGGDVPHCYLTTTVDAEGAKDSRNGGRADITYKLDTTPYFGGVLGVHELSAGYQQDRFASFFGSSYAGGTFYRYSTTAGGTNFVRVRHFQTGANVVVDTNSFYVKDSFKPVKDLVLTAGLRDDSFKNKNGDGETYVKQNDILQPRVSFAWDVSGDSTKKLYGSYGLYSLPIAATVAIRGASASIFDTQNFNYNGFDPITGRPNLTTPRNGLSYLNAENGETPFAASVASADLDPTKQDEYILGYQQDLGGGVIAGIRGTYRNLKTTIDDTCDDRPISEAAIGAGYSGDRGDWSPTTPGCFLFNPGKALNLTLDLDNNGTYEKLNIPADQVGEPAVKRKYYSVELTLDKAWSNKWFTALSYTWAHNYGNAEGLVKSDIGQSDTGTTQDFDFPELMRNSYGNLPNDRRHSIKGQAGYRPVQELTLTANAVIQTGRPKNCFGVDPIDVNFEYGASYFSCNGQAIPRGTLGYTETMFNLDLGASYRPAVVNGLLLQAKVFNVLDTKAVTAVRETGEIAQGGGVGIEEPAYGTPRSYQAPRYVQFSVQYDFDFSKK